MVSEEMALGMLFHELMHARRNVIQAELAARGLSDLGAPMILFAIRHRGREGEIAVQREVADILKLSPATVAVSLKSLARAGYVEKRPDAADARRKRIALTDRGVRAEETCAAIFRAVDERMCRGLTGEETARLTEYLKRMRRSLCDGDGPGFPHGPCERKEPTC